MWEGERIRGKKLAETYMRVKKGIFWKGKEN